MKIGLTILICYALSGCEYISSKMQKDPATLKQQKCWGLKNQIAFDQGNIANGNTDLGRQRITETAKAMSEYKENDCEALETSPNKS